MTIWKGFYPFEEQKEFDKQPVAAPVGVPVAWISPNGKILGRDDLKQERLPDGSPAYPVLQYATVPLYPATTPAVAPSEAPEVHGVHGWVNPAPHAAQAFVPTPSVTVRIGGAAAALATPTEVIGLDKPAEKCYTIRLTQSELDWVVDSINQRAGPYPTGDEQKLLDKLNNL